MHCYKNRMEIEKTRILPCEFMNVDIEEIEKKTTCLDFQAI